MNNDAVFFDEEYLLKALKLAQKGRFTTMPNPNVGCVIVKDDTIVGEGYHVKAGEDHAEINALRVAGDSAKGATVYVTLEPCSHYGRTPPCTAALIESGIKRIVIAMLDPNPNVRGRGIVELQNAGIIVHYNIMLKEAEEINKGFIKRIRTGLPWITLKLATSLDGRSAMYSGESKWITSVQSRQDVQCFRAESDVILSTASTVLADNPRLNVRWDCLPEEIKDHYDSNKVRQPFRVIIDSANRILPTHRCIQNEGKIFLARIKKDNLNWPKSVEQLLIPTNDQYDNKKVNLVELIKILSCLEINTILVEAGSGGDLLGLISVFVIEESREY